VVDDVAIYLRRRAVNGVFRTKLTLGRGGGSVCREQFTLHNENGKPLDLQLVKWSPVGHSLVVVNHYNLYYIKNITDLTNIVQLTTTGDFELYNGIPDWVYEGTCFEYTSSCPPAVLKQ